MLAENSIDVAEKFASDGFVSPLEILSQALQPSVNREVRYEHEWQEGDFVAWLNTLVLHSASDPSQTEGRRLMHRVRLSTPKL